MSGDILPLICRYHHFTTTNKRCGTYKMLSGLAWIPQLDWSILPSFSWIKSTTGSLNFVNLFLCQSLCVIVRVHILTTVHIIMKFSTIFTVSALAFLGVSAAPLTTERSTLVTRVDPNLVPQFGLASGINPTGTGKHLHLHIRIWLHPLMLDDSRRLWRYSRTYRGTDQDTLHVPTRSSNFH